MSSGAGKINFVLWGSLFLFFSLTFLGFSQGEFRLSPGEVKEGWRVFYQKGCFECHSLWGEGGKVGSELSKKTGEVLSATKLAGILWNHAPEMWHRMGEERIASFQIREEEMAHLLTFLYFIRFMDQPGDVVRGEKLLYEKRCELCHSLRGAGRKIGADLSKWGNFVNPILWAQIMWNHAPQMREEMKRRELSWPQFKEGEMNDLISYIRSVSPPQERVYLPLGDPESGKELFSKKGCGSCHSVGGGKGIDLTRVEPFPSTFSQVGALMWDHLPRMWDLMERKGISPSELSAQEMADLISYIISSRYFKRGGKKEVGRRIFSEKGCDLCHAAVGSPEETGLSGLEEEITPIFLAHSMWNHGQTMLKEMRERGLKWPEFRGDEVEHLLEYLNSRTE